MIEAIPIPGAELYYDEHFLAPEEATQFFDGNDAGLPLDTASLVTKPTMAIPERITHTRAGSTSRFLGYHSCFY